MPVLASWFLRQVRILLHPILLALLLQVGVGDSHSQTVRGKKNIGYTISGTVVNSVTRQPIGRALVYSLDERFATLTDDHGHFELNMPDAPQTPGARWIANGQPVLQAKRPGYLTDRGSHGSAIVGPSVKEVTLFLVPEALIIGKVKFPSEAVDHAQVVLYRREVKDGFAQWKRLTQVSTRSDGEFRFADLRAGEYKIFTLEAVERDPVVNAPNGPVFGFPPRFFAAARDFASASTISVRAGETKAANIEPERQKYYEIKVPIADSESGPPRGLQVSVYAQAHRGPGFTLGFDPNQRAVRGTLPNGTYAIEATSYEPGVGTGTTAITVENAPVNAPPLTMSANASIEVSVRQDASVTGDPEFSPRASVTLQSAEEFSDGTGPGDSYQSQGDPQVLADVRPGRYWVQVQPNQSGTYVGSATSGTKDLLRTPLVIPFGGSVPPIEVTLRNDPAEIEASLEGHPSQYNSAAAASTSGSVTPNEEPGIGRRLWVYCISAANDASTAREFSNLPDGIFVLQQLAPGDYRILAFDAQQQLEYRNPAAMRVYETMGQVVHVSAGQKLQVQLHPIRSE